MRPVEYTTEAIIAAGKDLQAAGRNITGFALRQKVGGGYPARLKQVWDEHQSSRAATVVEPVSELPQDVAESIAAGSKSLTDRLAALAVELNDRAIKAADRRVNDVVRSAGEQREQGERELADASDTIDDLESKLADQQAAIEQLRTKLADQQAAVQAHAVALAQVRERLIVTEQAAKTAADQHAAELTRMAVASETERTRYQAEADKIRAELDRAQFEIIRQRDEFTQAQAKSIIDMQAAVTTAEALRTELAKVQAKAEAADEAHQEARKTAASEALRTTERMNRAEADRDSAREEAASAREEAAKLTGKLEAMQTQIADRPADANPKLTTKKQP